MESRQQSDNVKFGSSESDGLDFLVLPGIRGKKIDAAHPLIPLVYFLGVAIVTMFTLNPVVIAISFLGAISMTGMLIGAGKLLKSLAYSVPFLIIVALINPLFVHKGETVLFYVFNNPFTLEALIYGIVCAFMLVSVFYWFKCYSIVMTSDKFQHLFGRAIPKLSLVLSVSLAFVPKLKRQYRRISDVQKTMGMYAGKSFSDRILSRFRILSALIGWALEHAIETSDSMNARGYGLKGRTSYSLIKFNVSALISLVILLVILTITIVMLALSQSAVFYPSADIIDTSAIGIVLYISFAVLAFYGAFSEIQENLKWQFLTSKI